MNVERLRNARRARSSPAATTLPIVGGVLLAAFVSLALAAPLLAPYDPDRQVTAPFAEPSRQHLLGADDLGRDLLSQLIHGARVSLVVGVGSAIVATFTATLAGLIGGFKRGWLDAVLMRAVDITLALPLLPLLLVLSAFFSPGPAAQTVVIGLILAPRAAREIRAQVLAISRLGPVDAARSVGAGSGYILRRHILPGSAPVVVAQFVRAVAVAVAFESALSFLGLGDPTSRSWGTILFFANARGAFLSDAWLWWVVPPGLCIGLIVVAFAFIGFGFEERSDPRLREGGWRLSGARRPRERRTPYAVSGGPLLMVDNLTVDYGHREAVRALDSVSFRLERGELVALVGPSGSGKSTLVAAVMGMLRPPGRIVAGGVRLEGSDIVDLSPGQRRRLRGRVVALVPQAAMNALNPVIPVVEQVAEALRIHQSLGRPEARIRAFELLATVGLPVERTHAYPHQLSGGMRQRVAIAAAIANDPRLIVADEPTTGLDVVAQVEILDLLTEHRTRTGAAMIIVTHDRPALLMGSARVLALSGGRVAGSRLEDPVSSPPGTVRLAVGHPRTERELQGHPLLEVSGLRKTFRVGQGHDREHVLRGIDLRVDHGEIVGLVGRSGTGKTTLARVVAGLTRPESGHVRLGGIDLLALPGRHQRSARRDLQLIGQDPYGWLSPRMTAGQLVAEPLVIHRGGSRAARDELVREALADVGLKPVSQFLDRYAHELSGGERQRVALARALVLSPALIIADEPTSMLDADARHDLINLIQRLRSRRRIAFLCITHDLAQARIICDRILVIADGRIVEECDSDLFGGQTHHVETQRLLEAALRLTGKSWSQIERGPANDAD